MFKIVLIPIPEMPHLSWQCLDYLDNALVILMMSSVDFLKESLAIRLCSTIIVNNRTFSENLRKSWGICGGLLAILGSLW